ncbi:MAG TPA: peptidyl-prolyl cis-trans isomerase [Candidatus Dormibacteraeota bacterium]|nr:peptidyl-prolyl cis-trans isomerase [Candidatus Dormibacteraeota bacterium]
MRTQTHRQQLRAQVWPVRWAAPALAAFLILSCSGKKDEPASPAASPAPGQTRAQAMLEAQVVATVGGDPIPMKAFERYLTDNAGDAEDENAEQANAIKSRLLDQMIEEQLLLRQTKGLSVTVSESEIDDYLSQIGVTEGEAEVAGGEGKEAFREKVRQSVILQKVKDKAVLSKVEVAPGEVEDYLKKQPEAARVRRSVVLRQILIDDRSLADRLSAQLARDPSRFEALARENSVAPDKGQARIYTDEELPVELRESLFRLEPGQVSPVLENAGTYLIFQLVRKMEAKDADLDEVRHRVQLELFRKKGEQALERYIADLKKDTEIHVHRAVLPFEYAGEYRN